MPRIPAKEPAVCSRCGGPRRPGNQALCAPCHAAHMREWRKTHPLTGGQKKRDTARSYAGVYLRRGKLIARDCECCGEPKTEMHHQDHERPLEVTWLCRPCHLSWHAFWREISRQAFQQWLLAGRGVEFPIVKRETSSEAA